MCLGCSRQYQFRVPSCFQECFSSVSPAPVPYQGQTRPCTHCPRNLLLTVETTWIPERSSNRFPAWIIKVPKHQGMPGLTSTAKQRCWVKDGCILARWDGAVLCTAAFTTVALPGFLSWNLTCRTCLNTSLLTAGTLRVWIFPAESTECLNHCKNAHLGHFRYFESCRADIKGWECFLRVACYSSSSQSWTQFLACLKKISCF